MGDPLDPHRLKLREIFPFWGWQVRERDVHLAWRSADDLDLAVWSVFRDEVGVTRREWVISEPTGILPIDHIPGEGLPNAGAALHAFAQRWQVIANERLEDRIGAERTATLRRTRPDVIAQSERMRQMIGIAAELLDDCADDAG